MTVTYLEPDHSAVENDFVGLWRVWNGNHWVHGFKLKEQAKAFGRRCNGTLIGRCVDADGQIAHVNVQRI